ncbi:hypothetical protein [Bdellovibrio bacteriovorus]|uniref:hypothetical protein n=1 Tax=Bdellovibrio bacteriovorus TaxID=959 RepID=UPI000AEA129E|nr:hypothetical protein [Bdellovibrio bacteriovorus]
MFASWYRGELPELNEDRPSESGSEGQDEGEHEVVEISDDQWAIFWNQVRRGRELHKAGKSESACELIFAMCDEFDLL